MFYVASANFRARHFVGLQMFAHSRAQSWTWKLYFQKACIVSQIKIEKPQSIPRKRRKTGQKLPILTSLTIHFSSKSDKYSTIYKPLKIKFLWLQFSDILEISHEISWFYHILAVIC